MQTEKAFYRKVMNHKSIGPGGWKCNCCAPAPGKTRKLWKRDRKKVERLFTKLIVCLSTTKSA